jgi:hypothetical protein
MLTVETKANYFFPRATLFHSFIHFVLIAQQAGQAVVLGHLSLSMCLGRARRLPRSTIEPTTSVVNIL